ncbi:MAG: ABC transporter permease [Patescibacteria group bacterium]
MVNLKIIYRNKTALFWNAAMPLGLYIALSILPLPKMADIPYREYLLPGMIAYVIMTNGIYGLAYWMAEMRSKNIIKRFLVTPIKVRELALSLVASRLVVMFCQVTLLTLTGTIFFNTPFAGNYFSIFLLTVLGGAIFLFAGLLIANYSSSYETATPLTAAVGLPMAFLGNVFFPSEALPNGLKFLGEHLPISYLAEGLRHSYLQSFDFAKISGDLLGLFIWFMLLLAITIKLFKLKE